MWPLSTNCTRRPKRYFTAARTATSTNEPAIVVSPLRNAAGELAGAVYGYRSVRDGNARRTIRYLEAHMIELLAGAVSEGIARIEREAETDRRRVLLEQAAAISQNQSTREIATDEREVTLLFADLRNSTALAARSGTKRILRTAEPGDGMPDRRRDRPRRPDHRLLRRWPGRDVERARRSERPPRTSLPRRATDVANAPSISSDWGDVLRRDLQTRHRHPHRHGPRRQHRQPPTIEIRPARNNRQSDQPRRSRHQAIRSAVAGHERNGQATLESLRHTSNLPRRNPWLRTTGRPLQLVLSQTTDANSSAAWQTYHEALQCFEQGRLQEAADNLATIDPAISEIPSRFLAEHLNRELARQNRRRSTDKDQRNYPAA